MFLELLFVFIATFLGTGALNIIFRFLGKRGYMGNLYEPVRGGTPRGIGIIPFIVISLFLPAGFNNLVLVMGLCALVDDVIGRRRIANLPIEIGQLARGIGMLCVIWIRSKRSYYNELLYNSCNSHYRCSPCCTDSCILCSIVDFSNMYCLCSFRLFRKNHVR